MNVTVICFSAEGRDIAQDLLAFFDDRSDAAEAWCMKAGAVRRGRIDGWKGTLGQFMGVRFNARDAFVFIGAAGIAVRAAAPFVKSKVTDPAVICIDDKAKYVIPLLSGHIGGANELARAIAAYLDAEPVITTATDLNGSFAVDVFASRNRLRVSDMKKAKEISARLLDGEKIRIASDLPVEGTIPQDIILTDEQPDVHITLRSGEDDILCLYPPAVTLGVGCRKEKEPAEMEAFLLDTLREQNVSIRAVGLICSIDIKAEEEAIVSFSRKYHIPFKTFSAEELKACPGRFASSPFVAERTGVDNVCERSAMLGSGCGRLLFGKQSLRGMTAAAAAGEWRIRFE